MRALRVITLAATMVVPAVAQAAAGQVLFALGRVEIQRAGQAVAAARGTPVEVGDIITTGPTGLAQVRLQDGALLSLRHGSTLQVEEFAMPASAIAPAGTVAPAATGGRTVMRLLRGAFRTLTGLVGRSAGDSYRVVTPVATIGIRGTDYSAAYCEGDCGATEDGLYVGVSNGGIEVANQAGRLVLGDGQYGYVRDESTPPGRTLAPPAVLDAPTPPGDERTEEGGESSPEGPVRDLAGDLRTVDANVRPEGDYELRPATLSRYAFASGSFFGSGPGGAYTDERGGLIGLDGTLTVSIGTASGFDTGSDATTGLHWGRWHGGTATGTTLDGPFSIDLSTGSLHWVYAPVPDGPLVALTGQRSYALLGGSSPTASDGSVGVLGSATLLVDFSRLVVDSSVSVSFGDPAAGGVIWDASGTGSLAAGLFAGAYSLVLINGTPGGTGSFSGFLTADGLGAGLVFELIDANFVTTVNGAAAFKDAGGALP